MTGQASAQTAAAEDWQFIVTTHMPFHFDPYYFSKIGIAVLAVMLVFNIVALRNAETFALRFFRNFQIAIAAFFVLGVLFRSFELYSLLGYMPMRLFPILTPLFFLFAAFYLASRHDSIAKKLAICVVLFGTMSFVHPFDEAIGQLRETKAEWIAKPDDAEASLDWLQKNVPKDATILSSPVGRKFWYLSHRAQIVSYAYPRYEKLAEWRRRIADLTANVEIKTRESSRSDIEGAFSKLSADQIIELQRKYAATYLLSRTVYPFPVIFETETYKVYRLP